MRGMRLSFRLCMIMSFLSGCACRMSSRLRVDCVCQGQQCTSQSKWHQTSNTELFAFRHKLKQFFKKAVRVLHLSGSEMHISTKWRQTSNAELFAFRTQTTLQYMSTRLHQWTILFTSTIHLPLWTCSSNYGTHQSEAKRPRDSTPDMHQTVFCPGFDPQDSVLYLSSSLVEIADWTFSSLDKKKSMLDWCASWHTHVKDASAVVNQKGVREVSPVAIAKYLARD